MLYFIGLGLGDASDITVKGLEIVKKCKSVYLEAYTSILTCGQKELEDFYGRKIILADRDLVEQNANSILEEAENGDDVAFLVVGDPFGATTHSDLALRARKKSIETKVVHNASIINAIGSCGLQLYNFGETVSIPFWTENWEPESFYDKIAANKERGLHTLCLLDIKVKEQSIENLMRGRKIYEPPRFMMASEAAKQLLKIIERRKNPAIMGDNLCVAAARIGSDSQKLVTCTLTEMEDIDMGAPLHSIVIIGKMHCLEEEAVKMFSNLNS